MASKTRNSSVDRLVNEFADCVSAQTRAISQGDPKTGNTYAKRYIAAFNESRRHGDEGRNALSRLFLDKRRDVRVMAASFLLRHRQDEALAILKRESLGNDLIA